MSMKIEYVTVSGYTSRAYVSWLNEGRTARGVHKPGDYPVYVRWHADREKWVEEDPLYIIKDYILSHMGHCDDCRVTYWEVALHRNNDEPPRCDCAHGWVEGLFAEIAEEEQR